MPDPKPQNLRPADPPPSMTGSIRRAVLWVGLLGVVLTAIGASFLFHRAFSARGDAALRAAAQAAAAHYTGDAADIAALIPAGDVRLTLIDSDGSVLYDSTPTAEDTMENHAARPEVAAALASGSGADTRRSATVGIETHYYALRLPDGRILRAAQDFETMWGAYNRVLPLLAVGCAVVAALAAWLAWALTRRLVRPIVEMAAHLDTLEASAPYAELLPLARTVAQDRALREENETMRREFTANVSHELKTPLTSISGYAELIETGIARPEDVPRFGRRIHREAQRMIALVSDILQLSELDGLRGRPEHAPEMAVLDLNALLHDCAAGMTVNARKAYVTLTAEPAPEPVPVTGSRDLLGDLLTNLCDNAIRYNRPGGQVVLRCGHAADGSAWLSVADDGIGIPAEAQSRVFERFYRVDKSRSKATGGTGLGLAIVKHIALLHQAKIDLDSAPGRGTTVRVTFPK